MTETVTQATDASYSTLLVSWLYLGSKIVGGLVLTLLAILYTNQEKMLYMPNPPGFPRTPLENPPGYQSPASWGTNGRMLNPSAAGTHDHIEFEEGFVVTTDGVKIHTWLLLQPDSEDVPTLLYFHGNAGNMGFLLKNAALMFAHAKINILLMDYRGYGESLPALFASYCTYMVYYVMVVGRSEGIPSEKGINLDAEAVLKYCIGHPRY